MSYNRPFFPRPGRTLLEEPSVDDEWESIKMAKRLYKSCMNETLKEELGLKPVRKVLDQIGGWPVVDGEEWKSDWKW